jgi:hypothetical protein
MREAPPLAREVGATAESGLARPVYRDAAAPRPEPEEPAAEAGEQPRRRIINQPEPEPLDLGEASREAVLKRLIPAAAGLALVAAIVYLILRNLR